ncbi:hypothetical protein BJ912DRAFT_650223 [Pholiota molesta]|nr:hypothetical protein BJ912DRAFT_650223 [Pholiota molesta]
MSLPSNDTLPRYPFFRYHPVPATALPPPAASLPSTCLIFSQATLIQATIDSVTGHLFYQIGVPCHCADQPKISDPTTSRRHSAASYRAEPHSGFNPSESRRACWFPSHLAPQAKNTPKTLLFYVGASVGRRRVAAFLWSLYPVASTIASYVCLSVLRISLVLFLHY